MSGSVGVDSMSDQVQLSSGPFWDRVFKNKMHLSFGQIFQGSIVDWKQNSGPVWTSRMPSNKHTIVVEIISPVVLLVVELSSFSLTQIIRHQNY